MSALGNSRRRSCTSRVRRISSRPTPSKTSLVDAALTAARAACHQAEYGATMDRDSRQMVSDILIGIASDSVATESFSNHRQRLSQRCLYYEQTCDSGHWSAVPLAGTGCLRPLGQRHGAEDTCTVSKAG